MSTIVSNRRISGRIKMLLAGAAGIGLSSLLAQSVKPSPQSLLAANTPNVSASAHAVTAVKTGTPVTYLPSVPRRAREYYGIIWGVDSFSVKQVESGELIRFSWRVLNSDRAKLLNEEKVEPYLIDPARAAKLVVPELPFMGKMRVKSAPEAGKTYWMGFSNPGKVVKPGDRVIIVIGRFYANALVVQ